MSDRRRGMGISRTSLVSLAFAALCLGACGGEDAAEDAVTVAEPTESGASETESTESESSESGTTDTESTESESSETGSSETEAESGSGEAPVTVSADRFTVDHDCGFGFAKGSDTQDLGLVISFTGSYTPSGPDLTEPVNLPDDLWMAEVQTGADLFSNWCNDAVSEDDPIPRIDQSWTVAEGTITVTSIESRADVAKVEAKLVGAVLVSAAGERLELDPIPLTNNLWGFFAG